MFIFCRVNSLLAKQNFHNQTSKLFLNSREINFRRNETKLSNSNAGVHNQCSQVRCRHTESVIPLSQGLFSLYPEKKNFIPGRNLSTTNILRSWTQSNQDKEKLKNYIFFGTILFSVFFVIYMVQTMEYHQDYVQIEPSEENK